MNEHINYLGGLLARGFTIDHGDELMLRQLCEAVSAADVGLSNLIRGVFDGSTDEVLATLQGLETAGRDIIAAAKTMDRRRQAST